MELTSTVVVYCGSLRVYFVKQYNNKNVSAGLTRSTALQVQTVAVHFLARHVGSSLALASGGNAAGLGGGLLLNGVLVLPQQPVRHAINLHIRTSNVGLLALPERK